MMQVDTVEDASCTPPRSQRANDTSEVNRGRFFPPLMGGSHITFAAREDCHRNDNKDGGKKRIKKAKGSKRQFHLKYRRKLTIRSQLMENTTFTLCVCVGGLSAVP